MLRACFAQLALDESFAITTKSAMANYLSMYSYLDITKNYTAEPRFAVTNDLAAIVAAIPTSGITEYEFHSRINLAVRANRDAHTQYTPPQCISGWRHTIRLRLYVYQSGDSLVAKVLPLTGAAILYAGSVATDYSSYQAAKQTDEYSWLNSATPKYLSTINGGAVDRELLY